jgi:hypothetical protein
MVSTRTVVSKAPVKAELENNYVKYQIVRLQGLHGWTRQVCAEEAVRLFDVLNAKENRFGNFDHVGNIVAANGRIVTDFALERERLEAKLKHYVA